MLSLPGGKGSLEGKFAHLPASISATQRCFFFEDCCIFFTERIQVCRIAMGIVENTPSSSSPSIRLPFFLAGSNIIRMSKWTIRKFNWDPLDFYENCM
jgi:hypothetical protein